MKPAMANLPDTHLDVSLQRGFPWTALGALFALTLRQHLRGRRLIVLSLLFLLPTGLVLLFRLLNERIQTAHLEFALIFILIPTILATLTALLYAAGIIQDEVEEQTLTYLLLRPIPRWALYLTKLLVTMLVTSVLIGVFTTLTLVVIYWGDTAQSMSEVLQERVPKIVALYALAQVGYCALFGALGLYTRRSLLAGLAYIIAFEGFLANFPLVLRQLTVTFYFRVLAVRWVGIPARNDWQIDTDIAPSAGDCVLIVLGASAVLTLLGAIMMMRQEFRMKTPEGS